MISESVTFVGRVKPALSGLMAAFLAVLTGHVGSSTFLALSVASIVASLSAAFALIGILSKVSLLRLLGRVVLSAVLLLTIATVVIFLLISSSSAATPSAAASFPFAFRSAASACLSAVLFHSSAYFGINCFQNLFQLIARCCGFLQSAIDFHRREVIKAVGQSFQSLRS